jgi:DNA polymerase-3 subunit delta'
MAAERPLPAVAPADALAGIAGQDAAVALLRRAIATGHVAHAYAFVGPRGSGRKGTALAFAEALLAPVGGRGAELVRRGAHPDLHVIAPTPPENNPKGPLALRVENIRELERLASLRPAEAPTKVFVVDEADRMTLATPQAFLKTLEEPPPRTVIVLILSQLRILPATVLSRCQVVRFAPAQAPGTVALLPDGRGEGRDAALACLAEAERVGPSAILRAAEGLGRDREAAEGLVETCWLWYRDLLCARAGAPAALAVFGDRAAAAAERAERLSLEQIVDGLGACRDAWLAIQGNVSPRLTVEVLLGRLAVAA